MRNARRFHLTACFLTAACLTSLATWPIIVVDPKTKEVGVAGAKASGAKRCGERKASSAFLTVCKPGDVTKHWLNLLVNSNDDHTPGVEALRLRFDYWKKRNWWLERVSFSTKQTIQKT